VKTIQIEQATLDDCVRDARQDRVLITQNGLPVALVIGLEGLDEEQMQLGSSDQFWKLIAARRTQQTIDRATPERELEERER
jgi:hypothetical protein